MLDIFTFLLFPSPQFNLLAVNLKPSPIMYPSCSDDRIYCQILKNIPKIDRNYAFKTSQLIKKVSSEYNIIPRIMTAILAQESRYKLNAVNYKTKDYGISQINHRTVEHYKFDKKRLLTDLEYSIRAGVIVLAQLKQKFGKEDYYWCRYNVGVKPKYIIEARCLKYKQMVAKFL